MNTRYVRMTKKNVDQYNTGLNSFIERTRKMRALNCEPSDIGIDSFTLRRIIVGKWITTKVI